MPIYKKYYIACMHCHCHLSVCLGFIGICAYLIKDYVYGETPRHHQNAHPPPPKKKVWKKCKNSFSYLNFGTGWHYKTNRGSWVLVCFTKVFVQHYWVILKCNIVRTASFSIPCLFNYFKKLRKCRKTLGFSNKESLRVWIY